MAMENQVTWVIWLLSFGAGLAILGSWWTYFLAKRPYEQLDRSFDHSKYLIDVGADMNRRSGQIIDQLGKLFERFKVGETHATPTWTIPNPSVFVPPSSRWPQDNGNGVTAAYNPNIERMQDM